MCQMLHCLLNSLHESGTDNYLLVEDVADGDGYVELHCRQCGAWVQHIGPEVAELPSLMVTELF